jgi:iron complex transport system ATP-binding protein
MQDLSRLPVTVVAALHDLDLATQYCDHIVLLAAGRVVAAGAPATVLSPHRIAQVFGVAAETTTDSTGRLRVLLSAAAWSGRMPQR